jgi:hypothetical protein
MNRPPRHFHLSAFRSSAGIAPFLVFAAVSAGRAEPAMSAPPTFAAHEIHGGLAIDRMDGGKSGVATAPAWIRLPGKPDFVVKDGKGEEAALWITAPSTVVVRKGASNDAPLDGRIEPRWDDEAIRLRIEPAHGPALESDVFEREDVGAGPRKLSRTALLSTDVQGSYRAVLRDPAGKPAGWMRVKVTTHGGSPTRFEAALPAQVDEGLAVASAAALGEEVDYIDAEAYGAHRGPMRRP